MEKMDQYWTPILLWRKRINIGHLFYYGENGSKLDYYFTMEKADQYWTTILLWRKRSILDNYFTMEKTDQYWTLLLYFNEPWIASSNLFITS